MKRALHHLVWKGLGTPIVAVVFACLSIGTAAQAQTQNLDGLLDIKNRGKVQDSTYTGSPFIYIDAPVTPAAQPQVFKPVPYQPNYTFDIKRPFGQKDEASFVPHTTDFVVKIQLLSNGDITIEESIQFVNTQTDFIFSRTFPQTAGEMLLLKATRDKKPVILSAGDELGTHVWTDKTPLNAGVHQYTISYLSKDALTFKDGVAHLKTSLTGSRWSLPVERFSGVVLFPKKTTPFKSTLLFGANEIQIPENTHIQNDENGDIFFELTHPLPAYADVRISVDFDEKVLITQDWMDQLLNDLSNVLFWICAGILIAYTLATHLFLKLSKLSLYAVKELGAYSYVTVRHQNKEPLTVDFINQLQAYYHSKKMHKIFFSIWAAGMRKPRMQALMKIVGIIFVYMNILYKYILTMAIIVGIALWQGGRLNVVLSGGQLIALTSIVLACLAWIYIKAERPYINRIMAKFLENTYNTDIGFGLSETSIQALTIRFYPFMLALGQGMDWINYMKQYNIKMDELSFLNQKEQSI